MCAKSHLYDQRNDVKEADSLFYDALSKRSAG